MKASASGAEWKKEIKAERADRERDVSARRLREPRDPLDVARARLAHHPPLGCAALRDVLARRAVPRGEWDPGPALRRVRRGDDAHR